MKIWGWKTITGVACMVAALIIDLAKVTTFASVDQLFGLGQIIAFFGLRDAIRKK